jgi:hypothetical protein
VESTRKRFIGASGTWWVIGHSGVSEKRVDPKSLDASDDNQHG